MEMYLPFNGKVKLTSPFGWRVLNGVNDYHKGVDLVALNDKTLVAPCDGIVGQSTIITDKNNLTWQWGNYIRLDCANGLYIFMCHLDHRYVVAGQKVKRGDLLGVMGNTGYSFGAHTHFEVRTASGESLNPCKYLGIPNVVGIYQNQFKTETEEDDMTGEQIYKALTEYLAKLPESEWSKQEGTFAKAKADGIMDGKNPRGLITREQLAAVLERALKK